MTTVQDLCTIYPFDEEHLDAILQAYEDIGIRCVFALQFADKVGCEGDSVLGGGRAAGAARRACRRGRAVQGRRPAAPVARLWCRSAIGIPGSRWRLVRRARNAARRDPAPSLPNCPTRKRCRSTRTSMNPRPMTLIARQTHQSDGGSLINYLKRVGLLTPQDEPRAQRMDDARGDRDASREGGTNVVLNPVGNLKTRSGVAPIRIYSGKASMSRSAATIAAAAIRRTCSRP